MEITHMCSVTLSCLGDLSLGQCSHSVDPHMAYWAFRHASSYFPIKREKENGPIILLQAQNKTEMAQMSPFLITAI